MKSPSLHARRLAYGIAHTTLSGSALDARRISKPSPRWWRWLVVAGVPVFMATACSVLGADVVRFVNWGLS